MIERLALAAKEVVERKVFGLQSREVDYLTGEETNEILLEECDGLDIRPDAFANGGHKSYQTLVPWDVPVRLALTSICIIAVTLALILVPELYEFHQIPSHFLAIAVLGGLGFGALSVLSQIPRRVHRNADNLIIDFLLHSHTVPLSDVLELVVLRDGRQFWQLLRRWKIFPSRALGPGQKLRLFFGAPSNAGSLCVVLTRKLCWSFVFCLQDPVQFLLDNQKPLNLEVTYKACMKCVLRQDEAMTSERIGTIPRAGKVKVLEQRGRRVRVKLEGSMDSTPEGWMSYLSATGVALLTRHVARGEDPQVGTIGASELSRSDGNLIELGMVGSGLE